MPYAGRLVLEGAKLGLRVGGILTGAALSALWSSGGRAVGGNDDEDRALPRTALDVPIWDDPDYVQNVYNYDEWLDGR